MSTNQHEIVRLLTTHRTFTGLSFDDFSPFLRLAKSASFLKGQALTQAKDSLSESYILVAGCVELTETPRLGHKISRQLFSGGTIIAGDALIKTWPQTCSSRAVETTTTLVLTREAFKVLLNSGNNVAFRILDHLLDGFVQDVRSANQQIDDIYSHPDETLTYLRTISKS